MGSYILAIDQGTTSSRAVVFDGDLRRIGVSQQAFPQHFPRSGWVEHDPEDLWRSVLETCRAALKTAGIEARDLAGIGLANQRETTLVGGDQNDRLVGGAGKYYLFGGRGNDTFYSSLSGQGIINGGIIGGRDPLAYADDGIDKVDYSSAPALSINIQNLRADPDPGNPYRSQYDVSVSARDVGAPANHRDLLFSIEKIIGSAQNDILTFVDLNSTVIPRLKWVDLGAGKDTVYAPFSLLLGKRNCSPLCVGLTRG